ncbi:MAG: O-antigen ligase family protein, partial [bacterium]
MSAYLTPLLQFQRFFLPGLFALLAWAVWRTVFRRDLAVGLALYLGLVIIVDGFFNTGIFLPGLEKGSIRYSELCAVCLLANRPPASEHSPRFVHFLVGLYFALLFLSALRSEPMMAGILEFRRLIVPQIVALLVAKRGLGRPEDYRRFFLCLTALVVIVGLFVFWDLFFDRWLLKSDILSKPEYHVNRRHGRFGSFFLNPNYLGAFTVLVFPAAFVWTLNERRPWPRVYAWMGLLILVFCLVETQSRGPLLAFAIALLALVFGPVGGMPRTRRLGFLALFGIVFTLFMPGFYEHASERFSALDEETASDTASRHTTWLYTMRIIAE